MSDHDRPLRVLVVTTVHNPLDARIHHRQIRAMRQAGWAVTYGAPFRAASTSVDELVPGTVPVDLPRAIGRRRLRALRAARILIKRGMRDHDVVLLHDPELVLAGLGYLNRAPLVLDVHEDLAASVRERSYLPRWSRGPMSRLVRIAEPVVERHVPLLLAEEQYRSRFARLHTVVPNRPWRRIIDQDAPVEPRVVYVGRLSHQRGVWEMIEVGRRLAEVDGPQVLLIGPADRDATEPLSHAAEAGWVTWQPFLPNDAALAHVEGSLAGLSLLHDTPNYRVSMPTKVLEYLSCGVPVICTPLPEAARVVESTGAGRVVPFGAVDDVVAALTRWHEDPSTWYSHRERAIEASHGFSWDAEVPAFLAALRNRVGA